MFNGEDVRKTIEKLTHIQFFCPKLFPKLFPFTTMSLKTLSHPKCWAKAVYRW